MIIFLIAFDFKGDLLNHKALCGVVLFLIAIFQPQFAKATCVFIRGLAHA